MPNTLLIFLGSGVGGLLRYWTIIYVYSFLGRGFPYGTLVVNIIGSFAMGLLAFLIQSKFSFLEVPMRGLLLVGLLGGYTTFSSFSLDTLGLVESGNYFMAILYVLLSVTLCLTAIRLGSVLGKQI